MSPDSRLTTLLERWQHSQEQGQPLTPEELCRDCPELCPQVKRCIAAMASLMRFLGGVEEQQGQAKGEEESSARVDDPPAPTVQTEHGCGEEESPATVCFPARNDLVVPAISEFARIPTVPGFTIEGELGHGGMGIVYKAWQTSLMRRVALKLILAYAEQSPLLRERFRRETEAVAHLQHANLVQIHEVGEYRGVAWYCMEFCPGGSLAAHLAGTPQPPRRAAEIVSTLAHAMQHAHERGIVHRDLKPANVLLTAEGTLKIGDFGLALRQDETVLTVDGEVLGTPCYMAPEQGSGKRVGPAADVYALGAILYECLTGRPPFKAATALETIRLVVEADPVSPCRLIPGIPRDLETICLKCLSKSPQQRYLSARELAADLERFQAGQPILARPIGLRERLLKWVRRQPLTAALIAAVCLCTLAGLVGITLAWQQAEAARQIARDEAEAKDNAYQSESRQRRELEQQLYFSGIALADRELRASKPAWALQALARCPARLQRWEWRHLQRQASGRAAQRFDGHEGGVSSLAFDRDSKTLVSAGADGVIRLRQASDGQLRQQLQANQGGVLQVCFSPDGRQLASSGSDGSIRLWRVGSAQPSKRLLGHKQAVSSVAFKPDGRVLASATFDVDVPGEVWLWAIPQGKITHRFRGHSSRITGLSWSHDGAWLASCSHDGTVRILDGANAQEVLVFRAHAFPLSAVAFSPDSLLLASAGGRLQAERPDEGEVLIWRRDGTVLHRLQGHTRRPTALAFSPDGQRLATAGWDQEIKLWDVRGGQEVLSLTGHRDPVTSVAFSPDGRSLASGDMAGTIRLWRGAD